MMQRVVFEAELVNASVCEKGTDLLDHPIMLFRHGHFGRDMRDLRAPQSAAAVAEK
jgi:hypothetical protein